MINPFALVAFDVFVSHTQNAPIGQTIKEQTQLTVWTMNAELVQYVLANSEANMLASHNCQLTHTYFSPNLDRQQECRLAGGYKEESGARSD